MMSIMLFICSLTFAKLLVRKKNIPKNLYYNMDGVYVVEI